MYRLQTTLVHAEPRYIKYRNKHGSRKSMECGMSYLYELHDAETGNYLGKILRKVTNSVYNGARHEKIDLMFREETVEIFLQSRDDVIFNKYRHTVNRFGNVLRDLNKMIFGDNCYITGNTQTSSWDILQELSSYK